MQPLVDRASRAGDPRAGPELGRRECVVGPRGCEGRLDGSTMGLLCAKWLEALRLIKNAEWCLRRGSPPEHLRPHGRPSSQATTNLPPWRASGVCMSASGRTRSRQRFPMRRRIDGGRSIAVPRGCGAGRWACALARSGSRAAALACLVLFCAIAAPAAAESQPPAPTSVVVYNIVDSQRLEVLWSYPTAALSPYTFDVFKMQWKSGNQAYDSSRELRLNPFNGGTISSVFLYSSGQKRYKSAITGLTAGIEYTVRVVAVNDNGDTSSPSPEATGTPQSIPDQALPFIHDEVISRFENSFPWLRSTWNYLSGRAVDWSFHEHGGNGVFVSCSSLDDNLRKCHTTSITIGIGSPSLASTIAHELAHVYTLSNGVATNPGPVAIGHVYHHSQFALMGSAGSICDPVELYADLLDLLTTDQRHASTYWSGCKRAHRFEQEALNVVRGAAEGRMPSWFAATYHGANGEPDLERLWADVKGISASKSRAATVFQLRNEFGGYCDRRKATESAFENGVTRNPWRDGGCVPAAPRDVAATAVGGGKLTVSWDPPDDDGGSPIEGYKVQWKSGTEAYDSSRQAEVTDLERLSHTIDSLTSGVDHSVRVVAYNHNGDGADSVETTATAGAQDMTAPQLSAATADGASLVLTWNETLDETSVPLPGAFEVSAGGTARGIGGSR